MANSNEGIICQKCFGTIIELESGIINCKLCLLPFHPYCVESCCNPETPEEKCCSEECLDVLVKKDPIQTVLFLILDSRKRNITSNSRLEKKVTDLELKVKTVEEKSSDLTEQLKRLQKATKEHNKTLAAIDRKLKRKNLIVNGCKGLEKNEEYLAIAENIAEFSLGSNWKSMIKIRKAHFLKYNDHDAGFIFALDDEDDTDLIIEGLIRNPNKLKMSDVVQGGDEGCNVYVREQLSDELEKAHYEGRHLAKADKIHFARIRKGYLFIRHTSNDKYSYRCDNLEEWKELKIRLNLTFIKPPAPDINGLNHRKAKPVGTQRTGNQQNINAPHGPYKPHYNSKRQKWNKNKYGKTTSPPQMRRKSSTIDDNDEMEN
jgi:hypothetical protein